MADETQQEQQLSDAFEALGWLGWVIMGATPEQLSRTDIEAQVPAAMEKIAAILRQNARVLMAPKDEPLVIAAAPAVVPASGRLQVVPR
jgi:hypothetical protein